MAAVTTALRDRAHTIFSDLGYDVSDDGDELRATRKWRSVRVTCGEPEQVPEEGEFRCFVTSDDAASTAVRRLAIAEPDYEWAVLAVGDEGEYDVLRSPRRA